MVVTMLICNDPAAAAEYDVVILGGRLRPRMASEIHYLARDEGPLGNVKNLLGDVIARKQFPIALGERPRTEERRY